MNRPMDLPMEAPRAVRDPKALSILAKSIYRELRTAGLEEREVLSLAGELLHQVATEVRGRRSEQS